MRPCVLSQAHVNAQVVVGPSGWIEYHNVANRHASYTVGEKPVDDTIRATRQQESHSVVQTPQATEDVTG
jgi:hypothetical protein